jgi:hypothetical protein
MMFFKNIAAKFREVETRCSQSESSKEGCSSKRAVLPEIIIIIIIIFVKKLRYAHASVT